MIEFGAALPRVRGAYLWLPGGCVIFLTNPSVVPRASPVCPTGRRAMHGCIAYHTSISRAQRQERSGWLRRCVDLAGPLAPGPPVPAQVILFGRGDSVDWRSFRGVVERWAHHMPYSAPRRVRPRTGLCEPPYPSSLAGTLAQAALEEHSVAGLQGALFLYLSGHTARARLDASRRVVRRLLVPVVGGPAALPRGGSAGVPVVKPGARAFPSQLPRVEGGAPAFDGSATGRKGLARARKGSHSPALRAR